MRRIQIYGSNYASTCVGTNEATCEKKPYLESNRPRGRDMSHRSIRENIQTTAVTTNTRKFMHNPAPETAWDRESIRSATKGPIGNLPSCELHRQLSPSHLKKTVTHPPQLRHSFACTGESHPAPARWCLTSTPRNRSSLDPDRPSSFRPLDATLILLLNSIYVSRSPLPLGHLLEYYIALTIIDDGIL